MGEGVRVGDGADVGVRVGEGVSVLKVKLARADTGAPRGGHPPPTSIVMTSPLLPVTEDRPLRLPLPSLDADPDTPGPLTVNSDGPHQPEPLRVPVTVGGSPD